MIEAPINLAHTAADGWSAERVAALKRHFLDGLTLSRSAELLGVTRSAVGSCRRRYGLRMTDDACAKARAWNDQGVARAKAEARAARFAAAEAKRAAKAAKPVKAAKPAPVALVVAIKPEPRLLPGCGPRHCLFPVNAPPPGCGDETLFCAAPKDPARSYCPDCQKIVGRLYIKPPKRIRPPHEYSVRRCAA